MRNAKRALIASVAASFALAAPAAAQKKYDPGASDTEIKVGNIMPYSGPASAYGTIGNWTAFMDKYYPEGDKTNASNVSGYVTASLLAQVLRQCGDNLTRENVMKQAANLKGFEIEMLMPGIKVNTSPTDYFPLEELQMRRFSGERWEPFGPVLSGEIGS
jgi:hypothetical protein